MAEERKLRRPARLRRRRGNPEASGDNPPEEKEPQEGDSTNRVREAAARRLRHTRDAASSPGRGRRPRRDDADGEQRGDSRGEPRGDGRGEPRRDGRGESRGGNRGEPRGESRGEPRGDGRGEPRRRVRRGGSGRRGGGGGSGDGYNGGDNRGNRRRGGPARGNRNGLRDATASRIAAAETKGNRRGPGGNRGNRGRGGGDRHRGLEILKALQDQVSIDPFERFKLETTPECFSTRVIDLIAPIGRGQRALIVSPPKAGKTTILIQISEALRENHPDVPVYALLVDERPEEVTHFKRSTHANVFAASSDMSTRDHIQIVEECINTIVEPVLQGQDVVLLLDSITRLARAYNSVQGNSGRTLSGGLDANTMLAPRQIFGAARKIEHGGSLTIVGTGLVETGSRMDEVIFQEFKGTGNTELVLSRDLFEKRIFPAVDIGKSGTRKEEKLYPEDVVGRLYKLRRLAATYPADQAMLGLLKLMQRHSTNEELLASLAAME